MQDHPRHGVKLLTIIVFTFIICILPVTFTPSGSWAGTVFTCLISTALFAFLYMTTRYKWLFILPVISYLVAFVITNNFLLSVEAVAFFPAGIALIIAVKKKLSRTATIITVSATLTISYLIYLLVSIFIAYGALNLESLEAFWNEATQPLRESYSQLTTVVEGYEVRTYSDDEVEYLIINIMVYIPATLICVTNIMAYISVLLYKGLAQLFGIMRFLIPDPQWNLTMSIVSAYIYTGVYLIIIFSGGSITGTVSAVAANILVMLTPGFSYIGVKDFIRRFKSDKGKKVVGAIIVLTVIFFIISPSMIFYIMSMLGVVETFMSYYTKKRSSQ